MIHTSVKILANMEESNEDSICSSVLWIKPEIENDENFIQEDGESSNIEIPTPTQNTSDSNETFTVKQEIVEEIAESTNDLEGSDDQNDEFDNGNEDGFDAEIYNQFDVKIDEAEPEVEDPLLINQKPYGPHGIFRGQQCQCRECQKCAPDAKQPVGTKPCEICGEKFSSVKKLKEHVNDFHDNSYPCRICEESFNSKQELDDHSNEIHVDSDLKCQNCGRHFQSVTRLRTHILKLHGQIIKCEKCHQIFKTKATLRNHIKVVHLKTKRFKCDFCGRDFGHKNVLETHRKLVHIKSYDFECDICQKKFIVKSGLDQHKRVHEEDDDIMIYHKCDFCPKSYSRKEYLKIHVDTYHKKTRGFKCETCGKVMTHQRRLDQHIKSVHDKIRDIKCEFCEQTFSHEAHRKQHVKVKHKAKVKDSKPDDVVEVINIF